MGFEPRLYEVLIPSGLIIGHVGIAVRVFRGGPKSELCVRMLSLMWTAALLLAWILRGAAAGRLPIFGLYESALSLALVTVTITIIWEAHNRGRTILSPLSVLIAASVLSHGIRFSPTLSPGPFTNHFPLIAIHAALAWTAIGLFALANFLSLRLILRRTEGADLGPSLRTTLRLAFVVFGIACAGGLAASVATFGTPFRWDPVEAVGLAIWVATGLLLITERHRHWPTRRLARWTLALFAAVIISSRGLVYLPKGTTYHVFEPPSADLSGLQ